MSAYIIVDIDVHDAPGLEEYRKQVPATVAKYGGRFVVRGGKFEILEGHWQPKRLVVLEFPSIEKAKRWYESEEYRPLKAMRFKASTSNMILVDGAQRPEIARVLIFYGWGARSGFPMNELSAYTAWRERMMKRPTVRKIVEAEQNVS